MNQMLNEMIVWLNEWIIVSDAENMIHSTIIIIIILKGVPMYVGAYVGTMYMII